MDGTPEGIPSNLLFGSGSDRDAAELFVQARLGLAEPFLGGIVNIRVVERCVDVGYARFGLFFLVALLVALYFRLDALVLHVGHGQLSVGIAQLGLTHGLTDVHGSRHHAGFHRGIEIHRGERGARHHDSHDVLLSPVNRIH